MRVLGVVMHKGGTGKTTVAVNLAAALARRGRRTVLVDLDPQGGATRYLALEAPDGVPTLADTLAGGAELSLEAAVPVGAVSRLALVPADLRLAGRERELRDPARLRAALRPLSRAWDVAILDTPPAWSFLSVNALVAAVKLLAPVQPKTLDLAGLVDLVRMVEDVRRELNPALTLAGIVPSRVQRTRLAREAEAELRRRFPGKVLPAIRESARVAEAAGYHLPVDLYAPDSIGAEDFRALTRAVARLVP